MAKISDINQFIETLLTPKLYQDSSVNGIQVESGISEITNVAVAVDSGQSIIDKAIQSKAQLLIVHHGLYWGHCETIQGRFGDKVRALIKGGCSLLAMHLPLDGNLQVGNNAELARFYGLSGIKPWYDRCGAPIGVMAECSTPTTATSFAERSKELVGIATPLLLPFGPVKVKKIAILSGSGTSALGEAAKDGADLFITGEPKQEAYHLARELKINALFAGHYATETLGVVSLGKTLERQFGVHSFLIDEPTGI